MTMEVSVLSLDNDLFRLFAFWMVVLLLKTVAMSMVTIYYRVTREKFWSSEDYRYVGITKTFLGAESDYDIDRVLRIHAHDIENILPFIFTGFFYIMTGPGVSMATWIFRIYAIGRLAHTFIYFFAVPQPARLMAFWISYGAHIVMTLATLSALI